MSSSCRQPPTVSGSTHTCHMIFNNHKAAAIRESFHWLQSCFLWELGVFKWFYVMKKSTAKMLVAAFHTFEMNSWNHCYGLHFTAYLRIATREGCCNSCISFKHWIHTTIQPHSLLSWVGVTHVLDGLYYSNIDLINAWKSCIQPWLHPLSKMHI